MKQMMNVKTILFTILAVMIPFTAWAQKDGSICEKAIYVDSTLVQKLEANTTYWFTANTEDLPLTVYFFPDEDMDESPEIYIDFTCTPGVYDNEDVRDIIDMALSLGIYMPISIPFEVGVMDGKMCYTLRFERELLDILKMLGIESSFPVYVSFRSPVSGLVQLNSIKSMTLCTDVCQRVEMRDTIYLQANKESYYYFPVSEWKGKDMSFIWTGESDLIAYGEFDCEFDVTTSPFVFGFNETNSAGQAVQKMSKVEIEYTSNLSSDGNLYVLFNSTENGKVVVTDYVDHGSVTISSCIANRKSTAISFPVAALAMDANIPSKSYRIEASNLRNKNIRLKWETTENKLAVAYFANFCGFELKAADPDVLDTVHLVYNEELKCMTADIPMERINKIADQHTDGWLFMQIYRQEAGTFSWDTYEIVEPDCDTKSLLLNPNDSIVMPANNYNTSYKMVGDDWKNFANTFTWRGKRKAFVYIADTCDFPLAPYNTHVGKYFELNPNQPVEISQKDLAKLVKNYALDGNLYLRLRSDAEGALVTSQAKPQDVTVEFNVTECDSYTWHGTTYTESGTYQHLGQTTLGADSLEILHLTINHSVSLEETVVACDSYTWNGNTYTTSGDYVYNGKTISDCDSIVTLKLTINYSDTVELTPVTATDSYVWHDVEYTESGTYTYLTQTEQGCDSLEILQITINSGAGVENAIVAEGENAKLVMINQSLYIQVQGTKSTEYYDLTGRKVDIMD